MHKVIFRDSRDRRELPDNSVDLEITCPPFFSAAYPKSRGKLYGIEKENSWKEYLTLLREVLHESYRCLKDGRMAVWIIKDLDMAGQYPASDIVRQILYANFQIVDVFYWSPHSKKIVNFLGENFDQLSLHYCYVLGKGRVCNWTNWNIAFESGIWYLPREDYGKTDPQPCSKRLIKRFISRLVCSDSVVVDPFLGTGTLIKACEETETTGIGYEINPSYKKVIQKKVGKKLAKKIRWIG